MQIFSFPFQSYSYNSQYVYGFYYTWNESKSDGLRFVHHGFILWAIWQKWKEKNVSRNDFGFFKTEQKFKCTDAYAKCLESDTEQRLFWSVSSANISTSIKPYLTISGIAFFSFTTPPSFGMSVCKCTIVLYKNAKLMYSNVPIFCNVGILWTPLGIISLFSQSNQPEILAVKIFSMMFVPREGRLEFHQQSPLWTSLVVV